MRKLPAAAQEERRRQVIGLRQSGMTYAAIAAQVGLTQTGMFDSCLRFAERGAAELVSGKRGRKPDEQRLLEAAHHAVIEVFYLPPCSPELPPDDELNADLKQAVTRRAPARSHAQLKRATISHMRRLAKWPARIRSYFQHKSVRYAV